MRERERLEALAIYVADLLLCAPTWFHREVDIFHSSFNNADRVRSVSLRVDTLVSHNGSYISEHELKLSLSLSLRHL